MVVALAVEDAMINALIFVSLLLRLIASLPHGVVVPTPRDPAIKVPLTSAAVPFPTPILFADRREMPVSIVALLKSEPKAVDDQPKTQALAKMEFELFQPANTESLLLVVENAMPMPLVPLSMNCPELSFSFEAMYVVS